ncbi:MAG: hypothetical protein ACREBI_04480 [Nitrosotalea sp.]
MNRRGLSTIVGMVFAIIALTSTVTYVAYSMNLLGQLNQTIIGQSQQTLNQAKENFQVTSAAIANNKLNLTVVNTGVLPINFTKIWVTDTTDQSGVTDWTYSYVPKYKPVAPGATLTNIGQDFLQPITTTDGFNIKLVTSRGNTQQFIINSVSSSSLNVQLLMMPPTIPADFTTQLVMIVTNNSTGVLTNVVPQTPQKVTSGPQASTATSCILGTLNPVSYSTLPIGETAIFSWPLTANGNPGQICTYTAQLQGSSKTVQATVTITVVSLVPATTYATYSGILTINYTNFKWTQGTQWNNGWTVPSLQTTDFSMTVTNNNNTSGGSFWISKNSQFMLFPTTSANGKNTPNAYFAVGSVTLTGPLITPYTDYSSGIPDGGTTAITIYFGATTPGGFTQQPGTTLPAGTYIGFIALYGKFAPTSGSTGTNYAQTIPFLAIVSQ